MATMSFIPSFGDAPRTIRDLELRMEEALDRLRLISAEATQQDALNLLSELRSLFLPPKYRATVQLEEDGRKKRSTAAATNWNPADGEIVLYFEPASGSDAPLSTSFPTNPPDLSSPLRHSVFPNFSINTNTESLEVQQCCAALEDAERTGKHFIALKWFRDFVLAALPHQWAKDANERQRVLTHAIDSGGIIAKKIPNPKSPAFPTTTLSLNRTSESPVRIESRFNPVPIKGEPGSVTLLRDRGSY